MSEKNTWRRGDDGKWHHHRIIYKDRIAKHYIDGELVEERDVRNENEKDYERAMGVL